MAELLNIERTTEYFTGPDGHRWLLRFHWTVIDGRPECIGMEIHSYREIDGVPRRLQPGGPHPITTGLVRSLPVARKMRESLEKAREIWRFVATYQRAQRSERQVAARKLEAWDWDEVPSRVGRRGHPPAFYEQVAAIYLEAAADPSAAPLQLVAAELGPVAKSTAAGWVSRARELGYLPPTTRGKVTRPNAVPSARTSGKRRRP